LAVDNLLYAARKRGLEVGIFCAIHTYGRRLNWHPHVHVSVTGGGIDEQGVWKNIAFYKTALRQRWMWNLRQYLISQWPQISLPPEWAQINSESAWRDLVLNAGGAHWHVYLSKKTQNGRKTVNYLGRYLKKPPISGSRLAHYTASPTLEFTYLDHRTQTYQRESLTQTDMLRRVIQHTGKTLSNDSLFWLSGQSRLRAQAAYRLSGVADGHTGKSAEIVFCGDEQSVSQP